MDQQEKDNLVDKIFEFIMGSGNGRIDPYNDKDKLEKIGISQEKAVIVTGYLSSLRYLEKQSEISNAFIFTDSGRKFAQGKSLEKLYQELNKKLQWILVNQKNNRILLDINSQVTNKLIEGEFITLSSGFSGSQSIYLVDEIKIMEFLNKDGYSENPIESNNIHFHENKGIINIGNVSGSNQSNFLENDLRKSKIAQTTNNPKQNESRIKSWLLSTTGKVVSSIIVLMLGILLKWLWNKYH